MTRLIFKYKIDPTGGAQHAIPEGSTFLDLQMQDKDVVMWWSVPFDDMPLAGDMSEEAKEVRSRWPLRTFTICPTGGRYNTNLFYVGTFQINGFVGHVMSYEPIPREDAN